MAQDVTWNTNNSVEEPILTEYNEITTLLRKPVKDKRRIKYTCFDVSSSYIALGSNSGSIYLFARETCVFQQLIPLSNGAVNQLLISPDEKAIALSTDVGNICMVVFKPTVKEAVISSAAERNGERATDLCWNDNSTELYIGGANGTVHVMGLSIFTVKRGIFQNPACPIMGLDYKVIQMDFSSPLLLVSTISDCYICDTVQGQYEKVGVRTRQGEFGACFYKPGLGREFDVQITEEQKFSTQGNSEFEEAEIYGNDKQYPRIYCARPGSRLWEAKPNGKIVKTHNFKEALAIPPYFVRKVRDETMNSSFKDTDDSSCLQLKSLKFSQLHIIANEYLFTYNTNAFYILDPIKSIVILWCNEYVDIKIGKVMDNKIYLMKKSGDFHCLELRQIDKENLKTKTKSLNKVNNSSLVVVNKISNELNKSIKSLVTPEIERKNDSGNNFISSEFEKDVKKMEINDDDNLVEDNLKLYKSKKLYDKTVLDVGKINFNDNVEKTSSQIINEETDKRYIEKESKDEIKNLLTDVQNIYYLANGIKIEMSDNEIDKILINVKETIKRVEKSYEMLKEPKPNVLKAIETAQQYYRTIFLSILSKRGLNDATNDNIFDEIIVSFLKINGSEYSECECGFPYYHKSTEFLLEPKFLDVGLSIIERYSKTDKNICLNLCKIVPYMWRIYLTIIENYYDDEKIFAQLLQTRDESIISFIVLSLNPKQWEFVKKAINNLENERCLICYKSIKENDKREEDKNLSINWNNVANEIIKRKGTEVAVDFLKKLINELPSVSLNQRLFESLIFTKILKNHGLNELIDFNKKLNIIQNDIYSSLCCPKVQDQLLNTLSKDLQTQIPLNNKSLFGTNAHHWGIRYEPKNSICPCCTLPLKTPVLLEDNGITLFKCGHLYHVNCLVQKNIIKCNLNHN